MGWWSVMWCSLPCCCCLLVLHAFSSLQCATVLVSLAKSCSPRVPPHPWCIMALVMYTLLPPAGQCGAWAWMHHCPLFCALKLPMDFYLRGQVYPPSSWQTLLPWVNRSAGCWVFFKWYISEFNCSVFCDYFLAFSFFDQLNYDKVSFTSRSLDALFQLMGKKGGTWIYLLSGLFITLLPILGSYILCQFYMFSQS